MEHSEHLFSCKINGCARRKCTEEADMLLPGALRRMHINTDAWIAMKQQRHGTGMHTQGNTHTHTHTCIHKQSHIHTHTHTNTHTHMWTNTHTHTGKPHFSPRPTVILRATCNQHTLICFLSKVSPAGRMCSSHLFKHCNNKPQGRYRSEGAAG